MGQGLKLAGVREVAEELGVSPQRASQLAESKGFPKPIDRIAAGPVWRLRDIQRFGYDRQQQKRS